MSQASNSHMAGNTAHYDRYVAKYSKSCTEWRKYSVPQLENACEKRGIVSAQAGSPVMVKLLVDDQSVDLRSELEDRRFNIKADPTGFIRKEEIRAVLHLLHELRKQIRIVTEVYIEGRHAVIKTNCVTACTEADNKCANKSLREPQQAARFQATRIQARANAITKRDEELKINALRSPALEKLLKAMRKNDDAWAERENSKVDRAVEEAGAARAAEQAKKANDEAKRVQLSKSKAKKAAKIQKAGGAGSQHSPTTSSPSIKAPKKRVAAEDTIESVDQLTQTTNIFSEGSGTEKKQKPNTGDHHDTT